MQIHTVTCAHSREEETSLFFPLSLKQGRCDCISSCNRKKRRIGWLLWSLSLAMFHRNMYSICRTDGKHTMTHAATLQNKKNQLFCASSMEDAWAASHPFPHHSADDSSPSLALASCLLTVRIKKKKPHKNKFLFFFFSSARNRIHLLTTAGARESLSSCVSEHGCTSKIPAYFLLPASRWRCSAQTQLTASTILWSHDLGHYQIRAITCYNSFLPQQLPGAVHLGVAIRGCVCVSLLSSTGGYKLCECVCLGAVVLVLDGDAWQ